MRILVLGGTADARHITTLIHENGLLQPNRDELIYSVAGLVRMPDVPCAVISGGFRQFGGLATYLKENRIDMLLDITHPFAAQMSTQAVAAAKAMQIPCWRFHRPAWRQQAADRWTRFQSWSSLIRDAQSFKSLLLTVGQISQTQLNELLNTRADIKPDSILFRTAAPARIELPKQWHWIKAIGPFTLADELALFQQYNIDLLITKNSGGESTEAKLAAARTLDIPVFMLERPTLAQADRQFSTLESFMQALRDEVINTRLTTVQGKPYAV